MMRGGSGSHEAVVQDILPQIDKGFGRTATNGHRIGPQEVGVQEGCKSLKRFGSKVTPGWSGERDYAFAS